MSKFTGNIIRLPAVTPTQNSASGVYTLDDQFTAQSSGTWPIVRDQYFNYTTLLLTGAVQGTAYPNPVTQPYSFLSDASTNNFVVSPNGDVSARPFNPYLNNYSNYFGGSGNYLSIADNAAFAFGSGDVTVECWAYATVSGASQGIVGQANSTVTVSASSFILYLDSTNKVVIEFYVGSTVYSATSANTLTFNAFNHIAAVRNGSTIRLFINGLQVGTGSITGSVNDSAAQLAIGRPGEYNAWYWNGYISNLRIVKGTAVYTSNFTPPTQPLQNISGTSLLTCQANRFIDLGTANSGSGFTITVTGSPAVSQNSPFVSYGTTNGSGYFDGTTDWLYTGTGLPSLGTSDFMIEMWIYPTTFASITYPLFSTNNGAKANVMALEIQTLGDLYWYVTGTTTWSITSASVGTLTLNQWSHIAFTRSGTSFKAYINGKYIQGAATSSQSVAAFNGFNIGQNGIPGGYFTGYMSSIRYVIGSAVYTGDFTPPTAPLTPVSGTSFLTLQTRAPATNNGFIDSSPNNFVVTRNGNTTQGSFSPFSPTGWSVLNGATSCLAAGSASDWTFLTNTTALWTIEMWVYPTVSGTAMILADNNDFNSANVGINFFKNSSNQVQLNICRGVGGSLVVQFTSTGTLNINAWNNIVITYDQSLASQNLKFYLNGASAETANKTANAPSNSAAPGTLTIGRYRTVAADGVVGYLGSLRISNIVRTPSGVPTSAYTNDVNTKLLICQYNRFLDGSANNYTLTVTNSPSVQAFSPFAPAQSYIPSQIGGSGYFDGTAPADYLSVPDNPVFDFGSGSWTVEAWFYRTGGGTRTGQVVYNQSVNAAASDSALFLGAGSDGLSIYISTSGSAWTNNIETGVAPALNAWSHVVWQRNGNTLEIYLNGTLQTVVSGSASFSGTIFNSTRSVEIGSQGGSSLLNGYLSGLRAIKGTAVYTSNFTPPTAPPTAIPNTSLLLNFTNGGIVDATGKNNLETVANSGVQTSQAKWSPGSMYFDGTSDYLSAPANSLLPFGTGDFTIEFWAYWTGGAFSTYATVIDTRNGSFAGGLAIAANITTGAWYVSISTQEIISTTAAASSWQHVAVTRVGTNLRLYVNGSQAGTPYTSSDNFSNTTLRVGIRPDNQYPWIGYVDDLRITKGYARYVTGTGGNAGQMVFNGTNTLALPTGPFPLG